MTETKRETTHKEKDDHGTDVAPTREVCEVAGWLYDPKAKNQYTGDNRPWRD